MPLNILSLDMDWFNFSEREDVDKAVDDFFSKLKSECVLPHTIHMATEHQYLYPWGVDLLERQWPRPTLAWSTITYRKIKVINIDEHHDFYYLDEIDFDSMDSDVFCGNFFAHMVHDGLLSEYTWVIDGNAVTKPRKDLNYNLRGANSKSIRRFGRTIKIVRRRDVFSVLKKQKFDGFIIVHSPEYVLWNETYDALARVLRSKFSRYRFQQCHKVQPFAREETEKIKTSLFFPA